MQQPAPRTRTVFRACVVNAVREGEALMTQLVQVTRGALTRLTRDELQGVIGHEFSHILNGDMRLNLRLIGVL